MSSGKAKEFETYARDCVKLAKQDNVSRPVTVLRARGWKTFSGPNPRKAYLERSAFALRLTLRSLHLDSRFCNLRYCCSAFAILGTPISGFPVEYLA